MKMKFSQYKYYFLVFLLIIGSKIDSKPKQTEKKKIVEKVYSVGNGTSLEIENKFGYVEVNNWDKSEIKITVEIISNSKNEKRAQEHLERINIDFSEGNSSITCSTNFDNIKSKNGEGFEVNYTIYMPAINPLSITNKFGDVRMDDRFGNLNLNVGYGSIKAGNVNGNSSIKVSFGKAELDVIKDGKIEVKYSNMQLEEADNIEVVQSFSDIELGKIKVLKLESKYGDVEIDEVDDINASVQFSGFGIGALNKSLIATTSYVGNFKLNKLAKTFTVVDIEGKFGSFNIGIEEGLNADLDAKFSFADLKISSDVEIIFNYKVRDNNKRNYKGQIGNGHPDKKIKINSSYGNARIDHY